MPCLVQPMRAPTTGRVDSWQTPLRAANLKRSLHPSSLWPCLLMCVVLPNLNFSSTQTTVYYLVETMTRGDAQFVEQRTYQRSSGYYLRWVGSVKLSCERFYVCGRPSEFWELRGYFTSEASDLVIFRWKRLAR